MNCKAASERTKDNLLVKTRVISDALLHVANIDALCISVEQKDLVFSKITSKIIHERD